MENNSSKFKNAFSLTLLILVLIPIGLIMIAIIPVLALLSRSNRTGNDRAYRAYLQSIEGTRFFCYNNRRDSEEYIERYIIPNLPSDVKLIYLEGKIPLSDYEEEFISTALYRIKDKGGFPYLLKVVDGEMLCISLMSQ